MADGRAIAAIPAGDAEAPAAALVCRPGSAMPPGISVDAERDLGADQSNTSVVLGEQVVLKAYRRLQPGLNPDLELTAYLTEEAGFTAVPPLAGFAEVISARHGTATVAIAQAYVVDGADLYESMAEALTAWILAPGEVTVEFATEVPADIGALTAGMHAALAVADGSLEFQPRDATPAERHAWATDAAAQLEQALDVTPDDVGRALRELAPAIAGELAHLETLAGTPLLTRVHGDYHLGQILLAPDGYRIIDFEGEPTRSLDERRAHGSPLRDVASMLRSIDHVGRSARRRAVERNGGPVASPGLDLEGWLRRSRERFIDAYRAGLREAGAPIAFDAELLRAFEIDKEVYEYIYAATWLPSWLWAPDEGMHGLFEDRA
jgi:maltose alpha-D-glucosyltransferase/alpha-amylase